MERILITGSSRGLGLEFVRQYLARGERVFAASRNPDRAGQLQELRAGYPDRLTLIALDVADEESIRRARAEVAGQTDALDLLINNAGVYNAAGSGREVEKLGDFHFEDGLAVFKTNSLAPLLVAQEFLDLLRKGDRPRIASISSGLGSIAGNEGGFPYFYSASKAALNMLNRSLAGDLRADGISAIVVDPGWVQTDMGGPSAPLVPEQSIGGMIRLLDGVGIEQTGQFLGWDGKPRAW